MAVHKPEKSGAEIVAFLKTFEGAASAFTDTSDTWALWIPEIVTGEYPVTPGSQIYFPVILRQGQQLIAIRFFYDCRTGKIKFYTGAIPARLSSLPEFEHAVSELFRHSLPVEPIKQRPLKRATLTVPPNAMMATAPRPRDTHHLQAETTQPKPSTPHTPDKKNSLVPAAATPPVKSQQIARKDQPPQELITLSPATPAVAEPTSPSGLLALSPVTPELATKEPNVVRVEICNGTTRVLQVLILVLGILGITAIAAFVYLQVTEDPGLKHHRLQLEQMRLRSNP